MWEIVLDFDRPVGEPPNVMIAAPNGEMVLQCLAEPSLNDNAQTRFSQIRSDWDPPEIAISLVNFLNSTIAFENTDSPGFD